MIIITPSCEPQFQLFKFQVNHFTIFVYCSISAMIDTFIPINWPFHFSLRPLQFYTVGGGGPSQEKVRPEAGEIQPFVWTQLFIFRLLPSDENLQEKRLYTFLLDIKVDYRTYKTYCCRERVVVCRNKMWRCISVRERQSQDQARKMNGWKGFAGVISQGCRVSWRVSEQRVRDESNKGVRGEWWISKVRVYPKKQKALWTRKRME